MGWNDKNQSTGQTWKTKIHTDDPELIKKLGESIRLLIEENNGEFIGNYYDILKKAGYDDTYYANLFQNMVKIKQLYNLETKRMGPRGTSYTYKIAINSATPSEDTLLKSYDTLSEIKLLINMIDIEKSNTETLKSTLKIIKKLCHSTNI